MSFYIARYIPKLVSAKNEGSRQKILIHQVFNRSVKVWSRYEGLSSIPPFPLAVLTRVFPGIKFYLPKFRGKDREILSVTGYSGQGDAIFFERIRINLSHLGLVSGLCQGSRVFPALKP